MQNWWNDYIGIQYAPKGRTRDGIDCWGLVRLIYKDQYNIDLPSYDGEYDPEDTNGLQELISINKENWIQTKSPTIGDVLLLRVDGTLSHVGVVISPNQFIHVRENSDVVIERFDKGAWKHRVAGAFKYFEKAEEGDILVNICPHPLQSQRIDGHVPANSSVKEIAEFIKVQYPLHVDYDIEPVIMVNGVPVNEENWDMVPLPGDSIQYRAVAKKGVLKIVLTIAVVVAVAYFAPQIAMKFGISQAPTSIGLNLIKGALTVVGNLLVNAIFPVRLPQMKDPGVSKAQNLLQGGSNQNNAYGSIPVVLGKIRYTPPIGAIPYVESNTDTSYLRTLLVWGYGPLQISDMRVGETDISNFIDTQIATVNGWADTDYSLFNTIYGRDVEQIPINVSMAGADDTPPSPWYTRTITEKCTSIGVNLHFPQGLRIVNKKNGNTYAIPFRADVQIRQLDNDTLAPLWDWSNGETLFKQTTVNIDGAFFGSSFVWNQGQVQTPVYRWTFLSLDKFNKIIVRYGSYTNDKTNNPSGYFLDTLKRATANMNTSYNVYPDVPSDEILLYKICMYGAAKESSIDMRGEFSGTYSGLNLTVNTTSTNNWYSLNYGTLVTQQTTATISEGSISRDGRSSTIMIGNSGEEFANRKDAFSYNLNLNVPEGKYEVRVRRLSNKENEAGDDLRYWDCFLTSITAYANRVPVIEPKPLAMTALKIKATDQFNGNIDGISATVNSICLDWDSTTTSWVLRPTRNPASLFRYVLQHPGNAQAVADSSLDLTALEEWHTYCVENGFSYDAIISSQQSLLDVLKDICAAGRSSPNYVDGQWTVVTDKVRTVVAQFFTPHNSWGFESVKSLPKLPHAFRVEFQNSEKGFQPDEMIVYNDGYDETNATLFELLQLPGVTVKEAVYKQARFHFAQIKLRPETYTLNADIEHLVCNRGDLVKVSHDVPMWGLATGRIDEFISTTSIRLDEQIPMVAGEEYTIRIRLANGTNITRTVASVMADGYYDTITLTSAITSTEGAAENLFMFGELSSESVELIVLSIEPSENMSARLTLCDYAPAIYNSDTEEIPPFTSKITQPPLLLINKITQKPVILSIVSDESVMLLATNNSYLYRVKIVYTNPQTLPTNAQYIEAQMLISTDTSNSWGNSNIVDLKNGCVYFDDVQEGLIYKFRLRYIGDDGRAGDWLETEDHTIVGKTTNPSTPTGLSLAVEATKLRLSWTQNPEIDIDQYEVRDADTNWGDSNYLFKGKSTTGLISLSNVGVAKTYYVRAIDVTGLYSLVSASISYTRANPVAPTSASYIFADTSLTNATITLTWNDASPIFGLDKYKITYDTETKYIKGNSITLPADWIGNKTFNIYSVDLLGAESSALSTTITKLAPNPINNLRAQVIDNNVLLYWDLPDKTSLPIQDVLIKKGSTYATAETIGTKSGGFTTLQELFGGEYTYWVLARDTDDNLSTEVSITVNVNQPPDYVFNNQFYSAFGGTKSNAILENGNILFSVNTTETWATHFTSRSWAGPSDQITAGYPYFIQPAAASGYYEEVFDNGTVINASNILVNITGAAVTGTPTTSIDISVSLDNITYTTYENESFIYGTNFRYIKVRFNVTSSATSLYLLSSMNVLLNSKVNTDSGMMSAVSTDASGTIVNFTKEFYDVISINVSPQATAVRSVIYDFKDSVISGTYSVTSNVVTVNATAHALLAGQKVRLTFNTGTAPSGVYTVASVVNANQYTVNLTTANTSGNITTYAESFRVYLYNSAGTRVSGTVSWSVRGY